jgi:hypothetical protein
VATRKWRSTRRAHYGPRLVDLRTAPTRIARSIEPIDVDEAIRESSSFQAIEDRAVAVDELIRDHDERHNGLGCGCLDAVLDSE